MANPSKLENIIKIENDKIELGFKEGKISDKRHVVKDNSVQHSV